MADDRALTVTEAMTAAKSALEGVRVRVVGEVSEFNDKPGYKAAYFTVSDGGAAMPCLMWRDQYVASGVDASLRDARRDERRLLGVRPQGAHAVHRARALAGG